MASGLGGSTPLAKVHLAVCACKQTRLFLVRDIEVVRLEFCVVFIGGLSDGGVSRSPEEIVRDCPVCFVDSTPMNVPCRTGA